MVSANPDQDDYGDEEQEATPSLILQNRFKGLNLDERADILSKFTSQKVLYDEPLSSTQILLLRDAETDQVSQNFALKKGSLFTRSSTHLHQIRRDCTTQLIILTESRVQTRLKELTLTLIYWHFI